jgi:hypothetical protein
VAIQQARNDLWMKGKRKPQSIMQLWGRKVSLRTASRLTHLGSVLVLVDETPGCRLTAERLVSQSQPCPPRQRSSQSRTSKAAWSSRRAGMHQMTCTMFDIQLASSAARRLLDHVLGFRQRQRKPHESLQGASNLTVGWLGWA